MTYKAWNTSTLNIGESVYRDFEGGFMAIDHLDRRVDPYSACVILEGRFVYTGLHSTLPDARQTCERKAKDHAL